MYAVFKILSFFLLGLNVYFSSVSACPVVTSTNQVPPASLSDHGDPATTERKIPSQNSSQISRTDQDKFQVLMKELIKEFVSYLKAQDDEEDQTPKRNRIPHY